MPGFKTFTAGSVLTAADVNGYLMTQAVPVFTNEAARAAAITAPTEGMVAYLTAPTVPTATGGTTYVPSGVITIYNGSVWACVTEVSAFTAESGTTTSASYTPTTTLGTNPSVTLVTGTTVVLSYNALLSNTGANNTWLAIAVSGATTRAANDLECLVMGTVSGLTLGRTLVLGGLTAGTNTFTMNYKVTAGTGSFAWRSLTAKAIA